MNSIVRVIFMCSFTLSCAMIPSDDNNCTIYKNNLALAVSQFTACAITYSRPITLCESCVDSYINVLESYHNLSIEHGDLGYCIDEYINLDRLEIVQTLYRNSYDLWTRAKCYECFQIENNTLTHNLSKETETFKDLLQNTYNCINNTNSSQTIYCVECIDKYLELNSYYISISNINEKIGVCMDIVDLMNETRTSWSKNCCEYRKTKDFIFLGATAVVGGLTILFYTLAKLCTDMKKPEIVHQSRFAGSLNQIDNSNEDNT